MKKFIIALVAVVLGLSSCSKENQLLGSWECSYMEVIGENGTTQRAYASEVGIQIILTFKNNGVVECKYTEDGTTDVTEGTYTDGIITMEGVDIEYKLSGKNLILYSSGSIEDNTGRAKQVYVKI